MATVMYNSAKALLINGGIDLNTDTIKCALVTSSYTPNIDTHDYFDDITNEVTHANYTAGGAELGNKTVTVDTATDKAIFDADDTTWANVSITARAAIIYKSTGTANSSALIAYIDFGADKTSTDAEFKITWATGGILTLG